MDGSRFDALTRSFAAPTTRRGLLGSLAALGAGLLGARGAADAQVSQAQCGNTSCKNNPGKCGPGCVCCVYGNGNTRCMAPGNCAGTPTCPPGQVPNPVGGCGAPTTTTTTTTTTPAPTTTTTTTAPSNLPDGSPCTASTHCRSGACCGGFCRDTSGDEANCGACGAVCPAILGVDCLSGRCCQLLSRSQPRATCSAEVPCCAANNQLCQAGGCCHLEGRSCGSVDAGQCCDGLVCSGGECVPTPLTTTTLP